MKCFVKYLVKNFLKKKKKNIRGCDYSNKLFLILIINVWILERNSKS